MIVPYHSFKLTILGNHFLSTKEINKKCIIFIECFMKLQTQLFAKCPCLKPEGTKDE